MITVWLLLQDTYEDGDTPDLVDIFDSEELANICMEKLLEDERKYPTKARYVGEPHNKWVHSLEMRIVPAKVKSANMLDILELTRQD